MNPRELLAGSATSIVFDELCLPDDEKQALHLLRPYADQYKLHPLTIEDCIARNQRCKLEAFDEYLFLVWHLYAPQQETYHEIQICLRPDAILIVAEGRPPMGTTWQSYLVRGRAANCNMRQTTVAMFDTLVDAAEDYLEVLRDGAATLEEDILDRAMDPREVLYLKKLVRQFNRSIRSAQPIFSQLTELASQRPDVGGFSDEDRLRLRNVTDHMTRLLEATQQVDSQMGTLMDVHWGALGARTNRQMQRLTTIATIFLPVSFWSGLFGMNFETMPFKDPWFFYAGMALLGVTWVVVVIYMFQRGVFGHEKLDHREPL
ncbi:MAG: hypothetical protein EOO75_04490, partial [Myxococcales bacterium]